MPIVRCHRSNCHGAVLMIVLCVLLMLSTMGITGLRTARLEAIMSNNLKRQISAFNQAETELNMAEHAFGRLLEQCLKDIPVCEEQLRLALFPDKYEIEGSEPLLSTGQFDFLEDTNINATANYLGNRLIDDEIPKRLHFFQITSYTTGTNGEFKRQIGIIYQQCSGQLSGPCPDPDYYSGRVAWKESND